MSKGVRCMWMRGGTSKGGYFLAEDLPDNQALRDAFLMRAMGSPDQRQIDGMGAVIPSPQKLLLCENPIDLPSMLIIFFFRSLWMHRWYPTRKTAAIFWQVLAPLRSRAVL